MDKDDKIMVAIVLGIIILITGFVIKCLVFDKSEVDDNNYDGTRFVNIGYGANDDDRIIVDKVTGVEYYFSNYGHSNQQVTVMIDRSGNPILYKNAEEW